MATLYDIADAISSKEPTQVSPAQVLALITDVVCGLESGEAGAVDVGLLAASCLILAAIEDAAGPLPSASLSLTLSEGGGTETVGQVTALRSRLSTALVSLFASDSDVPALSQQEREQLLIICEELDVVPPPSLAAPSTATASPALTLSVPIVPGLLEDGSLTPAFVDAISNLFNEYSSNKSELTLDDFRPLFSRTNADDDADSVWSEICDHFDTVGGDALSFEGFLALWAAQAAGDGDGVKEDLATLGYPIA